MDKSSRDKHRLEDVDHNQGTEVPAAKSGQTGGRRKGAGKEGGEWEGEVEVAVR